MLSKYFLAAAFALASCGQPSDIVYLDPQDPLTTVTYIGKNSIIETPYNGGKIVGNDLKSDGHYEVIEIRPHENEQAVNLDDRRFVHEGEDNYTALSDTLNEAVKRATRKR